MRRPFLRLFLAACGLALPVGAQQFAWEGQVDGVAVLHLRGDRLSVEAREGEPVQRQRFHFYQRLPDARGTVELKVLQGRGSVRVTEQPRLENDYAAEVTIEDRQPGASFYSIALHWATDRGSFDPDPKAWTTRGAMDRLSWSGRVQGEAVVSCRAGTCTAAVQSGDPVSGERSRFTRPLPDREVQVTLDSTDGRGEIRLIEQPLRTNNYTVRVRIRNYGNGRSGYSFVLSWQRPVARKPGVEQ